ncbi:MAG TPA: DUF1634 domain-containing protein [Terracidiphilus sp.]|jgi:uncharacterized membrane protein|nr:DUF1634 domain-containing protein [Terracidiphilus sp.]
MNDRRLEIIIGNLLRAGVLIAAATVLAGGVLFLAQHHAQPANYRTFVAGGADTRTLAGITQSAAHLDSEGLIQFGLLLLIATPVARVALAVVGFALERDRLYTLVSLVVLAILAYSLLHAT